MARNIIIGAIIGFVIVSILLYPKSDVNLDESVNGINDIKASIDNNKIILDLSVDTGIDCKSVIKTLAIDVINIRNRKYIPSCTLEDKKSIRIVYEEYNPV